MLIFGRDEELAAWVSARTGVRAFGPARAIGVLGEDGPIAAVVYSNMRDGDIEATIASDDPIWCRKGVLASLFYYPFVQLGCRRITCLIQADNDKSIRLCSGLGFQLEGRCRKVFGDIDALIYGMLREECRWIKPELRIVKPHKGMVH